MAVCLAIGFDDLHAQSTKDSGWPAEATSRLKAIYERSEFRVAKLQDEWLPEKQFRLLSNVARDAANTFLTIRPSCGGCHQHFAFHLLHQEIDNGFVILIANSFFEVNPLQIADGHALMPSIRDSVGLNGLKLRKPRC